MEAAPRLKPQRFQNALPVWILESPAYAQLSLGARALLQAIANACDLPDRQGNLRRAFGKDRLREAAGISRRSFWRHVEALQSAGFLVQTSRGGLLNGRAYGSLWAIPGTRGALDSERIPRVVVRLPAGADGRRHRVTYVAGDQLPLRGCEQLPENSQERPGTSANLAHPQCHGGTPPYPEDIPQRGKVFKDISLEGEGGVPIHRSAPGGGHPDHPRRGIAVRKGDFRSTDALLELYDRAVERGLAGTAEADRLRFVALAEHAITKVTRDGGEVHRLFAYLLYRPMSWGWISLEEEDRARRRLAQHDHGQQPGERHRWNPADEVLP